MKKTVSFSRNKNRLPLSVIKDSFKMYFQEMEKLLPMEGIYQILEKWFPLAKKSVSNNQNEGFVSKPRQNYVSTRQAKTITGINA